LCSSSLSALLKNKQKIKENYKSAATRGRHFNKIQIYAYQSVIWVYVLCFKSIEIQFDGRPITQAWIMPSMEHKYITDVKIGEHCKQEEIKSRLNSGNVCYHSVQSILSSRLLSRNVKFKIYKTIILPVRRTF
jgi:hypothetical protein